MVKGVATSIVTIAVLMGSLVACGDNGTDIYSSTSDLPSDTTSTEPLEDIQADSEDIQTDSEDPCEVLFFPERELSEAEVRGYEELCIEATDWEPGGRLVFEWQCLALTRDKSTCATYGSGINELAPYVESEYPGFILDKRCYANAMVAILQISPILDGRQDELELGVQVCIVEAEGESIASAPKVAPTPRPTPTPTDRPPSGETNTSNSGGPLLPILRTEHFEVPIPLGWKVVSVDETNFYSNECRDNFESLRTRLEPNSLSAIDEYGETAFIHIEHSSITDTCGSSPEQSARLVANSGNLGPVTKRNLDLGKTGWSFDFVDNQNNWRYDLFFNESSRSFAVLGVDGKPSSQQRLNTIQDLIDQLSTGLIGVDDPSAQNYRPSFLTTSSISFPIPIGWEVAHIEKNLGNRTQTKIVNGLGGTILIEQSFEEGYYSSEIRKAADAVIDQNSTSRNLTDNQWNMQWFEYEDDETQVEKVFLSAGNKGFIISGRGFESGCGSGMTPTLVSLGNSLQLIENQNENFIPQASIRGGSIEVPRTWRPEFLDGCGSGGSTSWADPYDENRYIFLSTGVSMGVWLLEDGTIDPTTMLPNMDPFEIEESSIKEGSFYYSGINSSGSMLIGVWSADMYCDGPRGFAHAGFIEPDGAIDSVFMDLVGDSLFNWFVPDSPLIC